MDPQIKKSWKYVNDVLNSYLFHYDEFLDEEDENELRYHLLILNTFLG